MVYEIIRMPKLVLPPNLATFDISMESVSLARDGLISMANAIKPVISDELKDWLTKNRINHTFSIESHYDPEGHLSIYQVAITVRDEKEFIWLKTRWA